MAHRFTKKDMERLMAAAADEGRATYSEDEVKQACRDAGIEEAQLEVAFARVAQRKRRYAGLAAGGLTVGIAGVLLVAPADQTLPLHNEQRHAWADVTVLVPKAAGDCDQPPDLRHDASDYCVVRTLRIGPRQRLRLGLPERACPVVWVRAGEASAVFELPASVEIEVNGGLDQKGLGAPAMFAAPRGEGAFEHCADLASGVPG